MSSPMARHTCRGIGSQRTANTPRAFGDLLAAVLAVAAIPAVATNARIARFLVWLFNIEGTLDLLQAIVLSTTYGAPAYMGPAYWIPASLLVTHYITFIVLWRHWPKPAR
jgi:hypothetical protein